MLLRQGRGLLHQGTTRPRPARVRDEVVDFPWLRRFARSAHRHEPSGFAFEEAAEDVVCICPEPICDGQRVLQPFPPLVLLRRRAVDIVGAPVRPDIVDQLPRRVPGFGGAQCTRQRLSASRKLALALVDRPHNLELTGGAIAKNPRRRQEVAEALAIVGKGRFRLDR